ncbi:hypothetical protein [Bacillus suaedae]|uniref:Uncharacterized protein n=1 Tax=Halalkalibacter suaedae TaxID=2822140 RepID=A0A940WPF2_9BACI|nr:hypothetical protein [Bacillus suaedae]MBP3950224.1 hypothetical protein [Bacillus suaedae]
MKIILAVDVYEDMVGQPFEIGDYLGCCLTIFVQQKGDKIEICHSTFHDALILDLYSNLIELRKYKESTSNPIETFENALEYTLRKTDRFLTIKEYSHYDKQTRTVFQGEFDDFFQAYFRAYTLYFKDLLQKDSNAALHESVQLMENQLQAYCRGDF